MAGHSKDRRGAVQLAAAKPSRSRSIGRPAAGPSAVGREGLIVAVCELLKTVNLRELTNGRIAEQAQVDTTLIRYHFKNRTELMIAVTDRITGEYEASVAKLLARGTPDARTQLFVRVGGLVDMNAKYPFFRNMLNEEVRGSDLATGRALMAALTTRGQRDFGGVIEQGRAEGIFAPCDPVFLLMAAVALAEATVSMRDPRLDPKLFAVALKSGGRNRNSVARYRAFVCELLFNGLLSGTIGKPRTAAAKAPAAPVSRRKPVAGRTRKPH